MNDGPDFRKNFRIYSCLLNLSEVFGRYRQLKIAKNLAVSIFSVKYLVRWIKQSRRVWNEHVTRMEIH